MSNQRPYLNLGAGRIILPAPRPAHHALVDEAIYAYPYWHNVDRNAEPGVDECVDLFTYPWPLESDSYDGALLSHIAEHIPHEIRIDPENMLIGHMVSPTTISISPYGLELEAQRIERLARMQDGWYAFFAELYRVLTPGAIVHVLSPYAFSTGAVSDPSHTRYLTEHSLTHSMHPDPNSPFKYETGGLHFRQVEPARFSIHPHFAHLVDDPGELQRALETRVNVAMEFYMKLEAVK